MPKLIMRCGKLFSRVLQDAELFSASVLLSAVLVIGLCTASHYGISIDEFNTDDYSQRTPHRIKALVFCVPEPRGDGVRASFEPLMPLLATNRVGMYMRITRKNQVQRA